MEPHEIIATPLSVYIAPVGESFPDIDADPAGNWALLGTNGNRNYEGGGVTVMHSKTYNQVRTAGSTGPVKAFLDEEAVMIRLTLLDLTAEQYAKALNDNAVTTTAAGSGSAGFKSLGLSEGLNNTAAFALLCRGPSPEDEAMNLQYEFPRVFSSGNAEPVFQKGNPAGLALEFTALEDLADGVAETERFGRYIVQHQAPLA